MRATALANPRHGLVVVAVLRGEHTKEVMCVGVPGVGLKDLAIKLLGELEVAAVVDLQSTLEFFIMHIKVVGTLSVPLDAECHGGS